MGRLERNLSDLPSGNEATQAWPPDSSPRFGPLLVEAWHAEADDNLPNAVEGARFRHSDAGACSRAVALSALGVPPSNPLDAPAHFITTQGKFMHEEFQRVLEAHYGGAARVEVKCGADEMGGHIDAEVYLSEPDEVEAKIIAIEYKSLDGFPYKLAIAGEGPKYAHIVQGCLNGLAINADEVVIIYQARGAISIQAAARNPDITEMMRVSAEWTYPRERYEPIAKREVERVTAILALLDDGVLAARKIPDPELPPSHIITDPRKGTWVSRNSEGMVEMAGTTWQCVYCRHQDTCIPLPAERCSTGVLT